LHKDWYDLLMRNFSIKRNIGLVERRIRALLGVILILLPLSYEAINLIAILGVILLLTSLFGRCPFIDFLKFIRKLVK